MRHWKVLMSITSRVAICAACMVFGIVGPCAGADSRVADAVRNRDPAAVRGLLRSRADGNTPGADGATPPHLAGRWGDTDPAGLPVRPRGRGGAANRYG